MSESSRSSLDEDWFVMSNSEYIQLLRKLYPKGIPLDGTVRSAFLDLGLIIDENFNDDFAYAFSILDRKKFNYARIKYEF